MTSIKSNYIKLHCNNHYTSLSRTKANAHQLHCAPPVLTDGVVHPSTSPPPPPPPLAAVSSITPFPLILFLLEDGFGPSCRAFLLVSHPPSLHPSLKRRRGEQGFQGNIKKETPRKTCQIPRHP
ncbi:hypothetical protein Q8A67_001788 [Cirrhinus molitorella]|uniref:Uncharacterized protein n=1 Tax=Cirrhinus molitorella TaxID=172907 RepID=A0AA88TX92_9TELE|nr:hypothetical protein Q8A67_001788 [Cirrhinus molitorella]